MAMGAIGGLIGSSLVSLVLVPALYVLMSRGRNTATAPVDGPPAVPVKQKGTDMLRVRG